ncbi:hypothetical protein DLAC_01342 [Tieghemostelium lacteum]|uniref:Uncharacterized protein n=1 Tax=Tieghemostelium lacteum TaxID=361077 RepID=A0A152A8U9_TIELA|nr:hypothetical protein DLAC_01342 [Tieghemostelium lacteum]|eukprot:KYR02497.1 hypothetical protein DLAC_01342 [Tieghemostelium lacteum]
MISKDFKRGVLSRLVIKEFDLKINKNFQDYIGISQLTKGFKSISGEDSSYFQIPDISNEIESLLSESSKNTDIKLKYQCNRVFPKLPIENIRNLTVMHPRDCLLVSTELQSICSQLKSLNYLGLQAMDYEPVNNHILEKLLKYFYSHKDTIKELVIEKFTFDSDTLSITPFDQLTSLQLYTRNDQFLLNHSGLLSLMKQNHSLEKLKVQFLYVFTEIDMSVFLEEAKVNITSLKSIEFNGSLPLNEKSEIQLISYLNSTTKLQTFRSNMPFRLSMTHPNSDSFKITNKSIKELGASGNLISLWKDMSSLEILHLPTTSSIVLKIALEPIDTSTLVNLHELEVERECGEFISRIILGNPKLQNVFIDLYHNRCDLNHILEAVIAHQSIRGFFLNGGSLLSLSEINHNSMINLFQCHHPTLSTVSIYYNYLPLSIIPIILNNRNLSRVSLFQCFRQPTKHKEFKEMIKSSNSSISFKVIEKLRKE